MNMQILIGRVGRDAEIRRTNAGDPVASFSVATSERWRDKATGDQREETVWHNVVVYNEGLCKVCEDHVRKGGQISIVGKTRHRDYETREGEKRRITEVVIGRFDGRLELLGSPPSAPDERGEGKPAQRRDEPARNADDPRDRAPAPRSGVDDDIPF